MAKQSAMAPNALPTTSISRMNVLNSVPKRAPLKNAHRASKKSWNVPTMRSRRTTYFARKT